jgi:hypothetical protein
MLSTSRGQTMSKGIESEATFLQPLPEYRRANPYYQRGPAPQPVYGCALPAELQAARDEAARQERIDAARRAVAAIEGQLGPGSCGLIIER